MKSVCALALALYAGQFSGVDAIKLHRNGSVVTLAARGNASKQAPPTFQAYYETHSGRGVWKWNVALDMYQVHMAQFAGKPAKIVEIGVQSGGSINMYEAVMPQCHYYGVDVNKNCLNFNDARTTITIGDQASVPVWQNFFSAVVPSVDVMIDDGGHQAHQMLATIQQALPHINPGGFFLTEDIHGQNDDYLTKFLHPAAMTIGGLVSVTGAQVESVHIYPFVIGVQMVGGTPIAWPAPVQTVASIPELVAALPLHLGGTVALSNPAWGSLLTPDSVKNFFATFYEIFGGAVREEPVNCHGDQVSANCAMIVTNTPQQNLVKGVHIMHNQVLVEVHAAPPSIAAYRKGQVWIPYDGP